MVDRLAWKDELLKEEVPVSLENFGNEKVPYKRELLIEDPLLVIVGTLPEHLVDVNKRFN